MRRAFPPGVAGSRSREGQQGRGPQKSLTPEAPVPPPEMSCFSCSWQPREPNETSSVHCPFLCYIVLPVGNNSYNFPGVFRAARGRLTLARVLPALPSSLSGLTPLQAWGGTPDWASFMLACGEESL